jgi:hypothetical protein
LLVSCDDVDFDKQTMTRKKNEQTNEMEDLWHSPRSETQSQQQEAM